MASSFLELLCGLVYSRWLPPIFLLIRKDIVVFLSGYTYIKLIRALKTSFAILIFLFISEIYFSLHNISDLY